jgi:hypothetical protein
MSLTQWHHEVATPAAFSAAGFLRSNYSNADYDFLTLDDDRLFTAISRHMQLRHVSGEVERVIFLEEVRRVLRSETARGQRDIFTTFEA